MNIVAEETYLEVIEETEELVILEEVTELTVIDQGSIITQTVEGGGRVEYEFDYNDVLSGSVSIGFMPSNKRVIKADLIIETEFDGNTTINIGDDDAQGRLINGSQNSPDIADTYSVESNILFTALTELKMFFTGNPAQGTGTIIIYYS